MLPGFIIIGAQRGGTTSLYNYLVGHPDVKPALVKEVHYFDMNYSKGIDWYRAHFPLTGKTGGTFMTAEASPYYIFHPHGAKRVATNLAGVKLIAMLRDPVERAYSHYQHEVRNGHETLNFEEALEAEDGRLRCEIEKMEMNEHYYSFNHHRFAYLMRGCYADQLERWFTLCGKDRLLVIKSEDFYGDPPGVFSQACDFLGLKRWELKKYKQFNEARYSAMDPATKQRLREHFKPHNRRLYELIDRNMGWED